jgi:hypothetical protein
MSRPALLCAGLVVLAASGCVGEALLAPFSTQTQFTRVADASPGVVSAVLQEGFGGVGLTMFVKRHGEEIRLAGQTKAGDVVCVYVRPGKDAGNKRSLVTVKWDRQPDEQLWKSIVEWLSTCDAEQAGTRKES